MCNHTPTGKLTKTQRTVKPIRRSKRCIWIDEDDQLWVKCDNNWWRFPQDIEY